MLAYLEELCTALLAHDAIAIHRLLAHPLARSLPRQVREEALAISRASPASLRAPIQTLRFYHQTLQLGEGDPAVDRGTDPGAGADSERRRGGTGARAGENAAADEAEQSPAARRDPETLPPSPDVPDAGESDSRSEVEVGQIELFDLGNAARASDRSGDRSGGRTTDRAPVAA